MHTVSTNKYTLIRQGLQLMQPGAELTKVNTSTSCCHCMNHVKRSIFCCQVPDIAETFLIAASIAVWARERGQAQKPALTLFSTV